MVHFTSSKYQFGCSPYKKAINFPKFLRWNRICSNPSRYDDSFSLNRYCSISLSSCILPLRWLFFLTLLMALIGWYIRELRTGWDPPILIRIGLWGYAMSVLILIDLSVCSVLLRVLDVLTGGNRGVVAGIPLLWDYCVIMAFLTWCKVFLRSSARKANLSLLSLASFNLVENRAKCFRKNSL